eukprot:gene21467-27502_t
MLLQFCKTLVENQRKLSSSFASFKIVDKRHRSKRVVGNVHRIDENLDALSQTLDKVKLMKTWRAVDTTLSTRSSSAAVNDRHLEVLAIVCDFLFGSCGNTLKPDVVLGQTLIETLANPWPILLHTSVSRRFKKGDDTTCQFLEDRFPNALNYMDQAGVFDFDDEQNALLGPDGEYASSASFQKMPIALSPSTSGLSKMQDLHVDGRAKQTSSSSACISTTGEAELVDLCNSPPSSPGRSVSTRSGTEKKSTVENTSSYSPSSTSAAAVSPSRPPISPAPGKKPKVKVEQKENTEVSESATATTAASKSQGGRPKRVTKPKQVVDDPEDEEDEFKTLVEQEQVQVNAHKKPASPSVQSSQEGQRPQDSASQEDQHQERSSSSQEVQRPQGSASQEAQHRERSSSSQEVQRPQGSASQEAQHRERSSSSQDKGHHVRSDASSDESGDRSESSEYSRRGGRSDEHRRDRSDRHRRDHSSASPNKRRRHNRSDGSPNGRHRDRSGSPEESRRGGDRSNGRRGDRSGSPEESRRGGDRSDGRHRDRSSGGRHRDRSGSPEKSRRGGDRSDGRHRDRSGSPEESHRGGDRSDGRRDRGVKRRREADMRA